VTPGLDPAGVQDFVEDAHGRPVSSIVFKSTTRSMVEVVIPGTSSGSSGSRQGLVGLA
jgi:hypothetical protein